MRVVCVSVRVRLLFLRSVVALAFVLCGEPLFAADATALSKQIDDLTRALTGDAAKDDAAQLSLLELLAKIAASDCAADVPKKADCKLGQLVGFAGQARSNLAQNNTTKLTDKQQADLSTTLQPLFLIPVDGKDAQLLSALELSAKGFAAAKAGVYDPVAVIAGLAGEITSAVPAITAAKPAGLANDKVAAMLKNVQTAEIALNQLLTALSADKRINILGAWYGDIKSVRSAQQGALSPWKYSSRFCSATRAVRTRCQSKPACYEPPAQTPAVGAASPNGASSELVGSLLCGYEPAPFADPRDKGVIISYECVALDAQTWKVIGLDEPVQKDAAHEPLDVLLRANTIAELRCQGNAPSNAP